MTIWNNLKIKYQNYLLYKNGTLKYDCTKTIITTTITTVNRKRGFYFMLNAEVKKEIKKNGFTL